MNERSPIGLIDSGIGGFTVLKELQQQLPHENIVYLGDSKRMPYGECNNQEIIQYAESDIRFLEKKGAKAILLACNTVSSLIEQIETKVPLFSIVEAGCMATAETCAEGEVGLIATTATVNNGAYERILKKYSKTVRYIPKGTKTLAAVINNHPDELVLLEKNIREAIEPILQISDIKELLLGCTHFPIVRKTIEKMYPNLKIINPAERQIRIIQAYLEKEHLINDDFYDGITDIYTTGSPQDYRIFEDKIGQLQIYCNHLNQTVLDID